MEMRDAMGVLDVPASAPRDAGARARRLGNAALALVALTTGLIVLGALVRAHDAGLACPDWPLCFGQVIPEMNLQVAFEWGHRAVAGCVLLAYAAIGALVWRDRALRRRVRLPLLLGGVLLLTQALLGALTVWQLLASWTVTSHLIVGNSFNACLLWLGLRLREDEAPRTAPPASAHARRWVLLGAALLLAQLVLGGLVSSTYAGMACPEWPACNGGAWFPSLRGSVGLHLVHRWNAVLLLGALLGAALACRHLPGLRSLAWAALGIGLVQLGVGIANVLLGIPVEVTGLHSALAAVLVLLTAAELRASFPGAVRAGT